MIAEKMSSGSLAFDSLLNGGLSTSCITDVYGAAGTGKTQFAFQNSFIVAEQSLKIYDENKPAVIFVDCAGSFRPERIAEIAKSRSEGAQSDADPSRVLSRIYSVEVRSVEEQQDVADLFLTSPNFSKCRLFVIDDVVTNFVLEFGVSAADIDPEKMASENTSAVTENLPDFASRHYELSIYARKLAYIAIRKNACVLLTNSVRSRFSKGESSDAASQDEVEATGEVLSQFCLYRLHFFRSGTRRRAEIENPFQRIPKVCEFRIESEGILP